MEILRPQDCLLRPNPNTHSSPFPNRRRSRPVKTHQGRRTPSSSSLSSSPPNPKHVRPNPKPSTSPVNDGVRLLKRGEAFQPATAAAAAAAQSGSVKKVLNRRSTSPPSEKKKTQIRSYVMTPPPTKPSSQFGSEKDLCFAGPNFAIRAPEASSLPQPGFLLSRSTSVGTTSYDEASKALRSLLKLEFL